MNRFARHGIVVTIATLIGTTTALGAAPRARAADPNWRIGADVSLSWSSTLPLFGLGSLAGLGGLSGIPVAGSGANVEARIGDNWWLLFGVDASYSSRDLGTFKADFQSVGGSVGARLRLAQLGPVMLSTAARADAQYGWSHQSSTAEDGVVTETRTDSLTLALHLGLAVDVALTDSLDVRFASDAAQLAYTTSESGDGVLASLDFRPTLGLGARF